MKPRRLNRRGEAARVEKRRGSTTVTTKWVNEQKMEQELHPFVPTIPLRYRKDHVMFHFDDEARIGVSKREQEEDEKRQREKSAEEERERQKREKEKEEREHHKKKEELRRWIQKEEEEKQKALGRAVLEWHKEVQRWGRARQEKGEILEGLRKSCDQENNEPRKEKGEKPCTCLPAGQGEPVIDEREESFVDSLEPVEREPKETSGPLLHSPANLLAHYAREAAREQPALFRESRMEHAPPSGNGQQTRSKETQQRRGSHSGLFENSQRESKEKSRKTSYPGRALRSSILAWREGVERVSRGGSARPQLPTSYSQGKARSERARSHDHVNFSKITTSITSPWVLRPGSLMVAPKTWPPSGRGSISRSQWRDFGERDTLFRSLSDPELAKVFDASSSSQGSTSAAASFNWSLRAKGEGTKGVETRWRPALDERSEKAPKTVVPRTADREDTIQMEFADNQREFRTTRRNPGKNAERVEDSRRQVRVDLEEREREEAVYDYLPHTLELSARLRHI